MIIKEKDPDATLDYKVDWAAWLDTDTIAASAWPDFPPSLTKVSDTSDDTSATIYISGGVLATKYEVTNRITTVGGRINDYTFRVSIKAQ